MGSRPESRAHGQYLPPARHRHGQQSTGIPTGFIPYDISNNGSGLSALFEVSFAARYRLTDNLGLRLGYQVYDITGLALAPRQLGSFGHGGNVALDGLSIGLQGNLVIFL